MGCGSAFYVLVVLRPAQAIGGMVIGISDQQYYFKLTVGLRIAEMNIRANDLMRYKTHFSYIDAIRL